MTTIPMLEKELKEAYRDLKYYKNYSERLKNQLQQKENIIKEVREYNEEILKENWYGGNEKEYAKHNLEILDKGE